MKIIRTSVEEMAMRRLLIGFEGENQRATVRIDCASVFAEYPNATPALIVKPMFASAFPVVVERNGDYVDWLITSAVLSFSCDGEIQLVFYEGDAICKSCVGKIIVRRSLKVSGSTPGPVAQWVDDANRKLAEVDAAIASIDGIDPGDGTPAGGLRGQVLAKASDTDHDTKWMYVAPMIKNSASGAIASFLDGAEGHPIDELWVIINPVQEGTGEPSTENVRPITGWDGVHIVVSPTTDAEDEDRQTYDISFPSEAGTVYGGSLLINADGSGSLWVNRETIDGGSINWTKQDIYAYGKFYAELPWRFGTTSSKSGILSSIYETVSTNDASSDKDNCVWLQSWNVTTTNRLRVKDDSKNSMTAEEFKAAMQGVQFSGILINPIAYTLTASQIRMFFGENHIWANTGNVSVNYDADTKLYIDQKIRDAMGQ